MGPTHVWLAHLYVKGVFLGWNIKSTSLKLAQGMHGKRLKYHGPIVAPLWEQPAWNERATSGRTSQSKHEEAYFLQTRPEQRHSELYG